MLQYRPAGGVATGAASVRKYTVKAKDGKSGLPERAIKRRRSIRHICQICLLGDVTGHFKILLDLNAGRKMVMSCH
jgi:hypothetical protein